MSLIRRKIRQWLGSLNARERVIVSLALISALGCAIYLPAKSLHEHYLQEQALIESRKDDLKLLKASLSKLQLLNKRLERVQQSYNDATMTFEEVTTQIDKLVRASIGSGDYEPKLRGSPSELGMGFEKQEFTLNVKSLSLEQLVKLLHSIEQSDNPLFLGKVDIRKLSSRGRNQSPQAQFSATLEVFSVRRQKA